VSIAATAVRWTRGNRGTGDTVPRVRASVLLPILLVLLAVSTLAGVGIGAVRIAPEQTVAIVLHHLGYDMNVDYTRQQDAIVWAIRMPRVILAILVGGALAVSGAALQGMFRNPLADPGLIGVSSGAALGAVGSIALGIGIFGVLTMPIFAFVGGVITSIAVYFMARHEGRTEVVTLVLTGIALNTIAGALTGLLTYIASDEQLRAVVFWSLGSLGGATWSSVGAATPFILLGMIAIPRWAGALNLFVLGEREARHLGGRHRAGAAPVDRGDGVDDGRGGRGRGGDRVRGIDRAASHSDDRRAEPPGPAAGLRARRRDPRAAGRSAGADDRGAGRAPARGDHRADGRAIPAGADAQNAAGTGRLGMTAGSLVLERVSLAIRTKQLLREISFAVEAGEVLVFVGPNGAGKSSLLRVLAGDTAPTSGRALLDGAEIHRIHPRTLSLRRAVLPQQTVLQFAFSVREVVEMGRGERRLDDDSIIVQSLERTDTLQLAERTFPSLSGGEQARVTLARVLAQETPILLLDEPTAALDLHHQQLVMDVARELARSGARVVTILHDLNLAAAYADRVGLMKEGRLVAIGKPWETFRADLLSDVFDCEIAIARHPTRDCPLVIPMGSTISSSQDGRPHLIELRRDIA
jgi:ABC-type hemin transport system ATPase subunit/ABC-type Fe3+-siderophore transport system permease subunit